MLRVVIVGYGEMLTNLIAATLDANCEIVGVFRGEMVKYKPVARKFKDIFYPSIEYSYIKSYNLPEIQASSVNSKEFKLKLLKLSPDIILVGSWAEKIKKEIYTIPRIACINAHPSLLPKYRGPNPYYWTIKNQEKTSGITFHLVDEGFDTGAILAQEEIKIYPSDTGKSLKERTVLAARGMCTELLNALKEDIIIPLQQREDIASYYSHPESFELDFRHSSEELFAQIRASYPWNKTYFYYKSTILSPLVGTIEIKNNDTDFIDFGMVTNVDVENCRISVLCGDNKIIDFKVEIYNRFDAPFTKNFIGLDVHVGELIS